MYELSILDRKYSRDEMKRFIISYTYSPNAYGYESGYHLMYLDNEDDAKSYLVRIKLALSVTSFQRSDITHVKSIVKSLVESESNAPSCLYPV